MKSYKITVIVIFMLLFVYGMVIWYNAYQTLMVHGTDYRSKALHLEVTTIEPARGFIFADGGEMLAGSLPEYDIFLDFKSTTRPDANGKINIPKQVVEEFFGPGGKGSKALAHAYSNPERNTKSPDEFGQKVLKAYSQKKGHELILRALPYLDYKRLRKQPYFEMRASLNGLLIDKRAHRYRPYGERRMAAATIGTVYTKNGKDSTEVAGHGLRGIEKGFDKWLAGIPGEAINRPIRRHKTNVTIRPAENGANVHTTINVEMQEILDEELAKRIIQLHAAEGWAAFMEVKTGKIKAISNMRRVSEDQCEEDHNHLFEDLTDPGSTFKTVSYMILLENGKITPDLMVDTENYDNDHPHHWQYHTKLIKDDHAIGKQTADEAIVQSSNIAVAKMTTAAYEKNPQEFLDAVRELGFLCDRNLTDEDKAEIDKNGHVAKPEFIHEFPLARAARYRRVGDISWSKVSLAQISYGYETQIPGIYMLQFYNAIANNGKLVRPYIVDYVEQDGDVLWEQETTVINDHICSHKTLAQVRHALEGVVEHGTAAGRPKGHPRGPLPGVKSDKVKIAGKTGTAQRYNPQTKSHSGAGHNVSFVGYFPADAPEYCGIVVINSYGSGIAKAGGGFMAGPVFRNFAEQVYARNCRKELKEMPADSVSYYPQIKKGYNTSIELVLDKFDIDRDSLKTDFAVISDAIKGVMPDVRNMGAEDALLLLETAGFRDIQISGYGKVISQNPSRGTIGGPSMPITLVLK